VRPVIAPSAAKGGPDDSATTTDNALTLVAGLKVIARTSAVAFKGKNEDIRRIAEALGVTSVLERSVRRS
jgi:TolB-like protein